MIDTYVAVGSRYPVNRKKVRAAVAAFLQAQGVQEAQVSVTIVGARRMKYLNEELMKHEGVTDVLSFPQSDPEQPEKNFPVRLSHLDGINHLGDIVVCFPEAVREARKLGKLVDDQICFLVQHGLLHLLGHHHD